MTKKEKKAYVGRIDCYVDTFESLKHIDKNGNEFWYARDLQPHFGYTKWQNFKKVITKARKQIKKNGKDPNLHLTEVSKMQNTKNQHGKTSGSHEVVDYALSRYGAYAVAVNTDPSKEEAAIAKEYFVVQTRNAEIIYQRLKDAKLLYCRDQLKHANKYLAAVLLEHDVDSWEIGIVMSKGDEGMHGMSTKELKKRYGIKDDEPLFDYLGPEVSAYKQVAQINAANEIKKKNIRGVKDTSKSVYDKNKEMRELFIENFGDAPENHIGKSDTKKIKKKYDSITDEFIKKYC